MADLDDLMKTDELWDAEKAAKFFSVDARYFNSSIKVMPEFPKATQIPSARSKNLKGRQLWVPSDIKKYFYQFYQKQTT